MAPQFGVPLLEKKGDPWRAFGYDKLVNCHNRNLTVLLLRNISLDDSEILPESDVLATAIMEDCKAALEASQSIDYEHATSEDTTMRVVGFAVHGSWRTH